MNEKNECYLVIDTGGTAIKYAWMSLDAEIIDKGEIPTPKTGLEEYLSALDGILELRKRTVSGVALSYPGTVDNKKGYIYSGGSLNDFVHNINIRNVLQERWGLPVQVEKDCNCAALAETWRGNLQGCKNSITLVMGTGIGCAVICNNSIIRGSHSCAGELSTVLISEDEKEDESYLFKRCGNIGLKEMAADFLGGRADDWDGRRIFQLANDGREKAKEVIELFTERMAVMIYNLQQLYDPERIAIGGGISAQPLLFEYLKNSLDRLYGNLRYPFTDDAKADVVPCRYRNDANLVGALKNYLELSNGNNG